MDLIFYQLFAIFHGIEILLFCLFTYKIIFYRRRNVVYVSNSFGINQHKILHYVRMKHYEVIRMVASKVIDSQGLRITI